MKIKPYQTRPCGLSVQSFAWILSALLLASGAPITYVRTQPLAPPAQDASQIPADQLDALVAPVALYPDPMLSQVLVASTYPLEIVQAQQWVQQNSNLKGSALADAAKRQDWDPSVQAMVAFPDLLKRLSDNIKYTTDLGNAFLAQQGEVMDAIQRMRRKAQDSGKLASTEQQVVETKTEGSETVVVIQPASPEVVYVPSYDPTAVWGAPAYPYPSYYYPPYPTGAAIAASAISFGVGVAVGAIWGGGWGWGFGWGNNEININNNFINRNNLNVANIDRSRGDRNTWRHNPQHRGGAPYANRDVANRFGGTARGDSLGARQASARQQQRQSAQRGTVGDRAAGGRVGDRPGADRPIDRPVSARPGDRPGGAGRADVGATRGSAAANRIGDRQIQPSDRSARNHSAFGGISHGDRARANTSRGFSSMGSSRGGGFSRGGGGFSRGGGGRRGGGRRG
jgi:uncharacterized membrane protein YgcG